MVVVFTISGTNGDLKLYVIIKEYVLSLPCNLYVFLSVLRKPYCKQVKSRPR